jgi:hypothetical protein
VQICGLFSLNGYREVPRKCRAILSVENKHVSHPRTLQSAWHPTSAVLAVCTGTDYVYLWTEQRVSVVALGVESMWRHTPSAHDDRSYFVR